MSKFILIIEDNELNVNLMSKLAIAQGYSVKIAGDTKSALRIASENCGLVISDICLPDQSGFEIVDELRNLVSMETPIIACTAFSVMFGSEKFDGLFDESIAKPINVLEYLTFIDAGMRGKKYLKKAREKINKIEEQTLSKKSREKVTEIEEQKVSKIEVKLEEKEKLIQNNGFVALLDNYEDNGCVILKYLQPFGLEFFIATDVDNLVDLSNKLNPILILIIKEGSDKEIIKISKEIQEKNVTSPIAIFVDDFLQNTTDSQILKLDRKISRKDLCEIIRRFIS